MNNIEIKLRELVKPKEINKIKSDVKTFELTEEKRYTYLNCIYRTNPMYVSDWWVNMHKTAFLKNKENGDTIYLIDAINIPFAPARHEYTGLVTLLVPRRHHAGRASRVAHRSDR